MTSTTTSTGRGPAARGLRTVDIVVGAVVGVAFGVVFWAWNLLWAATGPAFSAVPPLQGFMYGVWLVPGVLGALVLRRPGAAVLCALVASVVSALLGSQWGLTVVWYGLLQGAAPELVFLLHRYRSWVLRTAVLAGAAAGLAAVGLDLVLWYPEWSTGWKATYAVLVTASAALVAGVGSWLLVRALAPTGVLAPFPSGREQADV
jgi:energy-coupling factor transport system substrate-specific component